MTTSTKNSFVEVCSTEDLWEGEMECFDVGQHEVLVLNVNGEFQAFDSICPHQSVSLAEGGFEGKTLTCRAHQWSFDPCTGKSIHPAGQTLRRFPIRIAHGKVWVAEHAEEI